LFALTAVAACTHDFNTFEPSSTQAQVGLPPDQYGDDTVDSSFPTPSGGYPHWDGGVLFPDGAVLYPDGAQGQGPTDTSPPPPPPPPVDAAEMTDSGCIAPGSCFLAAQQCKATCDNTCHGKTACDACKQTCATNCTTCTASAGCAAPAQCATASGQ
jgi:hypothetical protein